jgi:hypothetical protein
MMRLRRRDTHSWLVTFQLGIFRGLIIRRFPLGLVLIGFLFLQIEKSSFQVYSKKGFIDFALITSLFSLIMVVFNGVLDHSSLRICG